MVSKFIVIRLCSIILTLLFSKFVIENRVPYWLKFLALQNVTGIQLNIKAELRNLKIEKLANKKFFFKNLKASS